MDNRYVEVHFKDETHDLKLNAQYVRAVDIKGGFLEIFDIYDDTLHCFDIRNVSHFHVPNEAVGTNFMRALQNCQ